MKTMVKIGIGLIGGIVVSKVITKVVKELTKNKPEEVTDKADVAAKLIFGTVCVGVGVKATVDILDDKSNAAMLMSIINSSELGTISKEETEEVIKYAFPRLREPSKNLLRPFINHSFPELLGGE